VSVNGGALHHFNAPGQRVPGARASIRIVLVEDNPDYALLVEAMLREGFAGAFQLATHASLNEAEQDIADPVTDCVLLDLSLPDARGLQGVERIQAAAPHVPIVILSGDSDEERATEAVFRGAQDYLVKRDAHAGLLARAVRYAIERKRTELELAYMAMHDSLTGVANRTLFMDRLELALARGSRTSNWIAVIFLDLDRFKTVNDSLGHDVGDLLLAAAADRLRGLIRPTDTLARFGGDEFMVLCDELEDEAAAVRVAERLVAGMTEPFTVESRELRVGVSCGIAMARADETSADELIRNADKTMYRAKGQRRRYAIYDEEAHADSLRRLELEGELHGALKRNELAVHYQPIIDLETHAPRGFEALLRWEHPTQGTLAPASFLTIASDTGLIFELGEWVLQTACEQLATWSPNGDLFMAVNLSPREMARPELHDSVLALLGRTGLTAERLWLEVTEDSVADDPARFLEVLSALRGEGVRVAMDDFGTGHSSLSALARYPIDVVKLDRTFLEGMLTDERQISLLDATVGIAHAFARTVVAEGIERREQLEVVSRLGCDLGQGFLFAHPAPAVEAGRILRPPRTEEQQ
jgi:diguanylate cyclase